MKRNIIYLTICLLLLGFVQLQGQDNLPDEKDFIPVEKHPDIDIMKLQKLVKYPREAKLRGIEGRVILKILVDKEGNVLKKKVEYSESKLLEESALSAIDDYGKVTPAIQNGKPVACWVSVPITYKLGKEESFFDDAFDYLIEVAKIILIK